MSDDWRSDLDSDRALLVGGGRGLVLGADYATGRMIADLDARWFVSQVTVAADGLRPEIGDIVIWRAEHADQSWMWNAPTRVVGVIRRGAVVDVSCLEDARLINRTPDWIDPRDIATDRVLTEDELWDLLNWWGLNPCCPRCGGEMLPIMYGMPAGDPGPGVIIGGCIPWPDSPVARCARCGYEPVSGSRFS